MGTRTLYEIQDSTLESLAFLSSNCSHPLQDAEAIFRACTESAKGPTALLQMLLDCRYASAAGSHRKGDRVFWLVGHSELEDGDHEALLTARYEVDASLEASRRAGDVPPSPWTLIRNAIRVADPA